MKYLVLFLFILAIRVVPNAVFKCQDPTWTFRPAIDNSYNIRAADKAKNKFCTSVRSYYSSR